MLSLFDPLNLVLVVAAGFIIWRLYGVLGQKTGHEGPRFDPFARSPASQTKDQEPAQGAEIRPLEPDAAQKPIWDGVAEEGSQLAKDLESLSRADRNFAVSSFLEGAKLAYEMTIEAFAKGDKDALKPLLNREVFDEFCTAIDKRQQQRHSAILQFVGVKSAGIEHAAIMGNRARVTVRFITDMISATADAAGVTIDGDPKQIREIVDVWTFERDVTTRDPNWRLTDTSDDS
jgi:predicted lipid-binding transport protein (Tim44 family)